jgi:triacylglycerol lipase
MGADAMSLDPKNTKHSLQNALALALISQLVYQDADPVRNGIEAIIGDTLDDFEFLNIPATDTQGLLAAFKNSIVLCFRGTSNLADWLDDGEIRLVPFRSNGLIHVGFRNALDSVYPAIEATLRKWSGKGRTLWVTGHSLGGALALLAAAYLRFPADPTKVLPRPIAGLYTFGQPRVGTIDFCQACDGNFGAYYFRYVNHDDIVTRIPPRVLFYWHGGRVEMIDRTGAIHDDPAWWQIFLDEVEVGMDVLKQIQRRQVRIEAIDDHFIANYIAAIRQNIPSR